MTTQTQELPEQLELPFEWETGDRREEVDDLFPEWDTYAELADDARMGK